MPDDPIDEDLPPDPFGETPQLKTLPHIDPTTHRILAASMEEAAACVVEAMETAEYNIVVGVYRQELGPPMDDFEHALVEASLETTFLGAAVEAGTSIELALGSLERPHEWAVQITENGTLEIRCDFDSSQDPTPFGLELVNGKTEVVMTDQGGDGWEDRARFHETDVPEAPIDARPDEEPF